MPNGKEKVAFSITTGSILKVIAILVAVAFLWSIRDIMTLVFVSLVLSAALDPTVDFLQRYRIPRALGTVLIYIVVISVFSFVIAGIAGPIATEVRNIAVQLPSYYREVNDAINSFAAESPSFFTADRLQSFRGGLDSFITDLSNIASSQGLPVVSAVFGGAMSLLLMLVITFYFIVQEGAVKRFISWLVPQKNRDETLLIIEKIQKKLGLWIRGQLLLSIIIFILTYAGLKIIGVEYALVLALLAGLFEVIPYLGPILSAIPAIFLTFASGGVFQAILVIVLYVFIQQAENNIIVPKVMSKTVGLNPLIVIISILIGAKLAGVVGAVIAVPVATGVTVYLRERGFVREEEQPLKIL